LLRGGETRLPDGGNVLLDSIDSDSTWCLPEENNCPLVMSAIKPNGKVRGMSSCSRPSFHTFASDSTVLFTGLRAAKGIVSKKVDGTYRSGPCPVWIKVRNPASIAVQRERSENWNR